MTNGIAVEAQGLRKTYRTGGKEVQALRGVNLEVEQGKVVCLLGPNGAGKTTLVKILATLLMPDGGWARVAGLDVVSRGNGVRKVIGYAGQDSERSAYFRLTARENLLFFSRTFHGMSNQEAKGRIEELADALGFADKLDTYFIALSGGEKQMFVIMRALISRPEVVFMDEPSKSLDPVAASNVRSYLKDYARARDAALLVTTHNMKEAEDISDSVIMINKGEVLFDGTPEGMKTSVMKAAVVQIGGNHIGEDTKRIITAIPGVLDFAEEGQGIRLYCRDAYEVLPHVVRTLKESGNRVPVGVEYLTLEEAFKIMVGGGAVR
jgi:ABC-2 type transport system ATP-binding protein